jgi:hypothetical protein
MPIFEDELGSGRCTPPPQLTTTPPPKFPVENILNRKASEESIRTELCEGPLLDSLDGLVRSPEMQPALDFDSPVHGTSNRVELIERLKRGESPTWVPKKNVRSSRIRLHHV